MSQRGEKTIRELVYTSLQKYWSVGLPNMQAQARQYLAILILFDRLKTTSRIKSCCGGVFAIIIQFNRQTVWLHPDPFNQCC